MSDEAVRRFEREAQVIARLRSPHTVELFDFGIAADGAFYYVMELLDGLDADSLLRRFGPIPPERAIYLLRQVCHSLSRGAVLRPGASRHQAGQHLPLPLRRGVRLREGAGFRDRGGGAGHPGRRARCTRGRTRSRARRRSLRPSRRWDRGGRAGRHLRDRLPGLLAPDRAIGVHRRHPDGTAAAARPDTTPTPPSARTDRPIPPALDDLVLSCLAKDPAQRPQSARGSSRFGWPKWTARGVDPGAGAGMVGRADADGAGVTPNAGLA